MRCRMSNVTVLGFLVGWTGCVAGGGGVLSGPEEDAEGVLNIAVASSALLDGSVQSYRVRLYHGRPKDWPNDSPYFFSGCLAATEPAFQITQVKVGTGYTVVVEGYSDLPLSDRDKTIPVCATLSALGVRGDVSITAAGTGEAFYYIHLNRRDAFTPLPLPGDDLNPQSAGLPCESDDYCRELIPCDATEKCPGGVKFRVHPKAVCDGGICRLLSLFPLNIESGRAFHAAASAGEGSILMLGGFDAIDAVHMASDPPPRAEAFNANTFLFSSPAIGNLDEEMAWSAVATMEERGIIALFGGVSGLRLRDILPSLRAEQRTCPNPEACPVKQAAFVVAAASLVAARYDLPVAAYGGVAEFVRGPNGAVAILLRPGWIKTSDTEIRPGDRAYLFLLGNDGTLSCADPLAEQGEEKSVLACKAMEGLTPRAAPVGVCFEKANGLCTRYLVIGGHAEDADAFAEVFDASTQTITPLEGDASLPKTLAGAGAVFVDNRIWIIGGESDRAPTVFALTPDFVNGEVHFASVVAEDDLEDLRRVFHQVTPLSDGRRVVVTGGLRDDAPLGTYFVLELNAERVSVLRQGKLDQPRFGHTATLIRGSILDGSILLSGGVNRLGDHPRMAPGAELYLDLR